MNNTVGWMMVIYGGRLLQMMGWSKKGRKMIYMMGKGPRHEES